MERTFRDIPEGTIDEEADHFFDSDLGLSKAAAWNEILEERRVLIISEAGAGKTYECQLQQRRLWDDGEPAFFLELALLAEADICNILSAEEEERFGNWLAGQSDVATFFLDSIDELKLTRSTFDTALRRFAKALKGQLGRARIIVTTRPVPFDVDLVRRHLPIPAPPRLQATGTGFAQIVMSQKGSNDGKADSPVQSRMRVVALRRLSDDDIFSFAKSKGIDDPKSLLDDLRARNALEFARRPQDLVELCADWKSFKRIRTHLEQVTSNVRVKLKPREERPELAALSVEKAIEGASRLALAMIVTGKLTIWHSAEASLSESANGLDPSIILSDWTIEELKTLLERPMFGFASYGRVRFHHRSVLEFLAAERLKCMHKSGMSIKALKRLLFKETHGRQIVRPEMRPIVGWLTLYFDWVFEFICKSEPTILLNNGDPESLTVGQRSLALTVYAKRYGTGGWRGLQVPDIQIHRFATSDLAGEINRLWGDGLENPDVREVLLDIISSARIGACRGLVRSASINSEFSQSERVAAIKALISMNDQMLAAIVSDIGANKIRWPDRLARSLILRLFPRFLTIERFCETIGRLEPQKGELFSFERQLVQLLSSAELNIANLTELRDRLTKLASKGLRWQNNYPHIVSDRQDIALLLAAVCVRGVAQVQNEEWYWASALALRLAERETRTDNSIGELIALLAPLSPEQHETLFWTEHRFVSALKHIKDPWHRFYHVAFRGSWIEDQHRDWSWLKARLADPKRSADERELLLQGAIRLTLGHEDYREQLSALKPLVSDLLNLVSTIEARLVVQVPDLEEIRRQEDLLTRRAERERQKSEDLKSWSDFWEHIVKSPDDAFSEKGSASTAWSLWEAMRRCEDGGSRSGWNRRFIEEQFDQATADRLRIAMMAQWRRDRPTLSSERPEDERDRTLVRWSFGLSAIYAESEDPDWATKLTREEASLAVRFAPVELNSLPLWLEAVALAHAGVIDEVLGTELTNDLETIAGDHWHSFLLQTIQSSPEPVAQGFVPRVWAWLKRNYAIPGDNQNLQGSAQRIEQVVLFLRTFGNDEIKQGLRDMAKNSLGIGVPTAWAKIWLPTLIQMDMAAGLAALEVRLSELQPEPRGEATEWFGTLFGDHRSALDLNHKDCTPKMLLTLLRSAYKFVRPQDDVEHEGSYSPDARDHAERGRHAVVNALLGATGTEAWATKLEMAKEPFCDHFKDRILAIAEENWAQEVGALLLSDAQAVALDKAGEFAATDRDTMFAIMKDRLEDIEELFMSDSSQKELWSSITEERLTRRAIADVLRQNSRMLYTVDQEGATAEEKETDIRLRSCIGETEAVIEVKLADKRTAKDLRDTIRDQLVTKYMAPENRRSGCLLLTIAKSRSWDCL